MKFYMIEDLNSGKWYKRGSYGNWVKQDEASVWTTPAGPSACLGAITTYNKRIAKRPERVRKPEIRILDLDDNPALKVLREMFAIIDLEAFSPVIPNKAKVTKWRALCARAQGLIS